MKNIHYWDRLEALKMYSVTRRFERYKIIYCKKIIMNLTPNCGLKWSYTEKYGYLFEIPKFKEYFKSQRQQSFQYAGPLLFNSLPVHLRKKKLLFSERWKMELDLFLQCIPDRPITSKCTSGLCDPFTSKPTNTLWKWIPHLGLSRRRDTPEENAPD